MDDIPTDAVDPNLAKRVTDLYGDVDKVLDRLKVPPRERKQVEKNLMEAVAADLLTRLGSKLTDDEKATLAGSVDTGVPGVAPDLSAVAGFFRGRFSQSELVEELAAATESVLTDFITEMTK